MIIKWSCLKTQHAAGHHVYAEVLLTGSPLCPSVPRENDKDETAEKQATTDLQMSHSQCLCML